MLKQAPKHFNVKEHRFFCNTKRHDKIKTYKGFTITRSYLVGMNEYFLGHKLTI